MPSTKYNLTLNNYVGGPDFDADYCRYITESNKDRQINVLIDSRGGSLAAALTISAAFAIHGNVHVHYTGINASAATIASLGARRVTIAPDAFYLVHQASLPFFEMQNLNSTQIEQKIKDLEKAQATLLTYDNTIAEAYARRCKKPACQLYELMKQERLLNAKEALEWGFVDAIESTAGDAPLNITAEIQAECAAIGMTLPDNILPKSPVSRFLSRIAALFTADPDNRDNNQVPADSTKQTNNNNQMDQSNQTNPANQPATANQPTTDNPTAAAPTLETTLAQIAAALADTTAALARIEERMTANSHTQSEAGLSQGEKQLSQARQRAGQEPAAEITEEPTQVISGTSRQADDIAAALQSGAKLYAMLP